MSSTVGVTVIDKHLGSIASLLDHIEAECFNWEVEKARGLPEAETARVAAKTLILEVHIQLAAILHELQNG